MHMRAIAIDLPFCCMIYFVVLKFLRFLRFYCCTTLSLQMLKRRLKDNAENVPPVKKTGNEPMDRKSVPSDAARFVTDNFDVGCFLGEGRLPFLFIHCSF